MKRDSNKKHGVRRDPGESYVWFTSLGLAVAILMIVFLLGLIVVNGLEVMWPKRVALIQLKPESGFETQDSLFIAGEVVTRSAKKTTDQKTEWQIFTGNRDAYGFSFKFIDDEAIASMTYPDSLWVVERREYGDALGMPTKMILPDGTELNASHPEFSTKLYDNVTQALTRWEKIKNIERGQIGKINARMEALRLKQKKIAQMDRDEKKAFIKESLIMLDLQAKYTDLAKQAQILRDEQQKGALILKFVTGEERKMAFGDIVDFYQANKMGFAARLGRFFKNLWRFLAEDPREANTEGGIFPAIFGTFMMTVLMSLAVTPFGVLAAVYLCEYAKQGVMVRLVRISVNNLAGVPSIVFGVFGLGFFVYMVGGSIDRLFFSDVLPTPTFGTGGILWAALTLSLMTVPVVIVATEEALMAVPRGVREASLACGASKWQTIRRLVLPAASPGIITGLILAMARGASEVAPLMLVGVVKLAPSLPVDGIFPFVHLERKFMHLAFYIYDLGFQSPDSDAAKPMVFATTLVLILLVLLLNIAANRVREKLRARSETKGF